MSLDWTISVLTLASVMAAAGLANILTFYLAEVRITLLRNPAIEHYSSPSYKEASRNLQASRSLELLGAFGFELF